MEASTHSSANASLHVFGIPELAEPICMLLPRRDNISLSLVCRQLFHYIFQYTYPTIWERVDDAENLAIMIGARVEYRDNEPLRPFATMHFPTSLDLSRLGLYAPFIKYLSLPITTATNVYVDWDKFLTVTRSMDLLPNLEHLKVTLPKGARGDPINKNCINWIRALLSSSLRSLHIYPDLDLDSDISEFADSWIGLELTSKLIQDLSAKCHKLSLLKILPGDVGIVRGMVDNHPRLGPIFDLFATSVVFIPLEPNLNCIMGFKSLRELSTTPFLLEASVFRALGDLPSLETLSIRDLHIADGWQTYDCPEVSPRAFPALRNLDLLDFTCDSVINISRVKRLAQALRNVRLITTNAHENESRIDQLLGTLAGSASPINDLCISSMHYTYPLRDISPRLLGFLSSLSLTRLSLPHPSGRYDWSLLFYAVPALEWLEITNWHRMDMLLLNQLRPFATLLPNLNFVSGPICLYSTFSLFEHDFIPPGPQCLNSICLAVHVPDGREAQVITDNVEIIASYLYLLWPNVQINYGSRNNPSCLIQLNDALSRLRGTPDII